MGPGPPLPALPALFAVEPLRLAELQRRGVDLLLVGRNDLGQELGKHLVAFRISDTDRANQIGVLETILRFGHDPGLGPPLADPERQRRIERSYVSATLEHLRN